MGSKNYLLVNCLKCNQLCNMNASGICKDCSSVACHWCGKKCRSKLKNPTCNSCDMMTAENRRKLRDELHSTKNKEHSVP